MKICGTRGRDYPENFSGMCGLIWHQDEIRISFLEETRASGRVKAEITSPFIISLDQPVVLPKTGRKKSLSNSLTTLVIPDMLVLYEK